ncbi:MAG: DUF4055 domain-containing protein [Actinobacteria bacterium]|nr:DUF4055 domain-containing protein [Actinomycetota bacterium]
MYSGFSFYDRPTADRKVTRVHDANTAWYAQEPHWMLIEDLIQGTYGMRRRHRRYLPQEPREQDESYDNRLARSVCPPYYQRLERMLAGMLTRKPVRLNDTSDNIREQLFDVDLQGNDLNVWTYETARKLVRYGHIGTLVDAPSDGGRPYWCTYTPRQILGWRTEAKDGQQQLTMLRLLESVIVPDGDYGEKAVQQVRVLTPGAYELHQKQDNSEFKIVEEGNTSLSDIPFSVAYCNRVGYLESRPPLEDIAELNLKTYQVQSDLDNQLHISAVPMLAFFGFPSAAEEVSAGPGEAIAFPENGRAEFIEPGGASFEYQFKRLEQLAGQINELGLSAVLGQKLSAETAEAKRIDRSQGDSTMMVVAQNVQDMIDNCLRFHAEYLGTAESAGSCLVNRDFIGARLEPAEIQALLQLYTAGTITQETLLQQLSDGEVLGDNFDVQEELSATANGGLNDNTSSPIS